MNCAACNHPINRFRGYYLVGDIPYCRNCYKGTDKRRNTKYLVQPVAAGEHDNLLEAFRAYQERERKSLCRSY